MARSIEVLDEAADRPETLSLFPEDRCEGLLPDASIVRLKLSRASPLPASPMGRVLAGAEVVGGVATRSVLGRAPAGEPQGDALGSGTVRAGRLSPAGAGQRVAAASGMVRADRRWPICWAPTSGWPRSTSSIAAMTGCWSTKQALFDHLTGRWRDLFNARFDLLLYDLTSTYFEAEPPFPTATSGASAIRATIGPTACRW